MGASRLAMMLLLLPALAQAQQATATLVVPGTAPEITLQEAIALAGRVQPSVVQAQAAIRNAEAQRLVTVGAWLPTLNASSGFGYFFAEGVRVDPNTNQLLNGESQTLNVGVSTSWDIFTGFRRGNDSRAAKAGVSAAQASFANASYQQRFNTTLQFFTALAGREIVSVREQSVKRAEEQLKAAVARLHAGTATRSDSLRSVVTLGNTQVALSQAQANLIAAEAALARLVGYDGRVRAADDSAFYHPVTAVDTTALMDEAMRRSPAVQSTVGDAVTGAVAAQGIEVHLVAAARARRQLGVQRQQFEWLRPAEPAAGQPHVQLGGIQPLHAGAEHPAADQQRGGGRGQCRRRRAPGAVGDAGPVRAG